MLDAAGYYLHDSTVRTDNSPTRTLPVLSLDTGLTFEGNGGTHDQRRSPPSSRG